MVDTIEVGEDQREIQAIPRLRLYRGELTYDSDVGIVLVVAPSIKKAKTLAYYAFCAVEDPEWIDVRISWVKNADITGLLPGIQRDYVDLIRRDLLSSAWNIDCPLCGRDTYIIEKWGLQVACIDCLEKMNNGDSEDV